MTLDGVMQAPGRPDEDRRGGFEHGGWATPYDGRLVSHIIAVADLRQRGGLSWPSGPAEENLSSPDCRASARFYMTNSCMAPPMQLYYKEIAQDLTSRLSAGRLLDVGTGPGRLLQAICRLSRPFPPGFSRAIPPGVPGSRDGVQAALVVLRCPVVFPGLRRWRYESPSITRS